MFWPWMHFCFVFLALVLPLGAAQRTRSLVRTFAGRPSRVLQRSMYPRLIATQWVLAGAVVISLCGKFRVPLAALGLARPALLPLAGAGVVIALAWAEWERRLHRAVHVPAHRARLLERFASLRFLVPADDSMIGGWIAVSITAGVCEETLYRGFVGFYLHHWMPMEAAALAGTLPFAFAHLYQGWRGMLRTGGVALLLWATYLATGSILPAMVLHAAIDVRSGLAAKAAFAREATESAAATAPA